MSQDEKVEAHVQYFAFKRIVKVFLTSTNKLDELKTQLKKYFVHLGENHTASHVFVQVPCVDLMVNKDENFYKIVYYP